jgi:hypothetical protein
MPECTQECYGLSLAQLYHPNLICCALHWRHRSAHAGYRVSHLAWPSVRALLIKRVYCYQESALYNSSQPLNREEASGVGSSGVRPVDQLDSYKQCTVHTVRRS